MQGKVVYNHQNQAAASPWEVYGPHISVDKFHSVTTSFAYSGGVESAYSKTIKEFGEMIEEKDSKHKSNAGRGGNLSRIAWDMRLDSHLKSDSTAIGIVMGYNTPRRAFGTQTTFYALLIAQGILQKACQSTYNQVKVCHTDKKIYNHGLSKGDILTIDFDISNKKLNLWKNSKFLGTAFENIDMVVDGSGFENYRLAMNMNYGDAYTMMKCSMWYHLQDVNVQVPKKTDMDIKLDHVSRAEKDTLDGLKTLKDSLNRLANIKQDLESKEKDETKESDGGNQIQRILNRIKGCGQNIKDNFKTINDFANLLVKTSVANKNTNVGKEIGNAAEMNQWQMVEGEAK